MGIFAGGYIIQRSKKDQYLKYIDTHVKNVNTAFCDNIDLFYEVFGSNAVEKAERNIRVHDTSKFSQDEFEAYRLKHYPSDFGIDSKRFSQQEIEYMYDLAWIHHYHHNPHHPEYWLTFEDKTNIIVPIPMKPEYIIEMICDWESFNYTEGTKTGKSSAYHYYHHVDKKENLLHKSTRNLLERILDKMNERDENE